MLAAPISKETASAVPAVVEPPSAPEPASLEGKVILHAGDSMVGGDWGLTRSLGAKAQAEGATFKHFTKVSETISSFDDAGTLRDLLAAHHPDIVIVTLGTNNTDVPHPEVYAKHIQAIAKRIAPRECWWMGPPIPDTGVGKVIEENCAPCTYFDGSKLTLDRAKDGIHPNDKGAAKWADEFWTAFRAKR